MNKWFSQSRRAGDSWRIRGKWSWCLASWCLILSSTPYSLFIKDNRLKISFNWIDIFSVSAFPNLKYDKKKQPGKELVSILIEVFRKHVLKGRTVEAYDGNVQTHKKISYEVLSLHSSNTLTVKSWRSLRVIEYSKKIEYRLYLLYQLQWFGGGFLEYSWEKFRAHAWDQQESIHDWLKCLIWLWRKMQYY